jgi:hypothetical protein
MAQRGAHAPKKTSWCAPRPSHHGAGLVLTGLDSSGTVTRTGKSQNCCVLWHYRRGKGQKIDEGQEGHLFASRGGDGRVEGHGRLYLGNCITLTYFSF